eukprot:COSAG01_NODE_8660_length_2705_cov_2.090944_4_plen_58_part_00
MCGRPGVALAGWLLACDAAACLRSWLAWLLLVGCEVAMLVNGWRCLGLPPYSYGHNQ